MNILNNKKKKKASSKRSWENAIIRYLAKASGSSTIPEIAEHLNNSVPTGTKAIMELLRKGYIREDGKRAVENGRKPTQYCLNQERFYVVGVEILSNWIHVSVRKTNLESVHKKLNREFVLEDKPSCLEFIESFISAAILESKVPREYIIGIGIGMTGEINVHTGQPINYFTELENTLSQHFESIFNIPVIIDNDTRAIAIAEQTIGTAKGYENVLIIKISRNLGLAIILDRKLVSGNVGIAGNLGHMQFAGTKSRLCPCGKTGCLGTEVGGTALKNDLEESLKNNKTSLRFNLNDFESYTYHQILEATEEGDGLAIQLLQAQGERLGFALGNILNLLNPQLVVIDGEFVMVKDVFTDALKLGMRKSALLKALNNCEIRSSTLGRYLSSKAGACLKLKSVEMISY